jgi:hypothetical protein
MMGTSDGAQFYKLVEYIDDIDIAAKLQEWETFYNIYRPDAALKRLTTYGVLKEKMTLYT